MTPLAGIGSYEPTELVVTVRAGTPLAELEAVLAEQGQCLAFEPPRFARAPAARSAAWWPPACAGPSRAAVGSVRDFVLGAALLNGNGELLSFGGQVMKNVAGYDVSRVLAGSLGILGADRRGVAEGAAAAAGAHHAALRVARAARAAAAAAMGRAAAAAARQRVVERHAGGAARRRRGRGACRRAQPGRRAHRARWRPSLLERACATSATSSSSARGDAVRNGATLWRLSVPARRRRWPLRASSSSNGAAHCAGSSTRPTPPRCVRWPASARRPRHAVSRRQA